MAAAHVFQNHGAVHGENLGLLAADAAIAEGEFVPGLAPDAIRRGANRNFAADAVWFDHDKSWSAWHRFYLVEVEALQRKAASRHNFAGTAHGRESHARSK